MIILFSYYFGYIGWFEFYLKLSICPIPASINYILTLCGGRYGSETKCNLCSSRTPLCIAMLVCQKWGQNHKPLSIQFDKIWHILIDPSGKPVKAFCIPLKIHDGDQKEKTLEPKSFFSLANWSCLSDLDKIWLGQLLDTSNNQGLIEKYLISSRKGILYLIMFCNKDL